MITISAIKSAAGASDYFAKAFDIEAKRSADNYYVNETAPAQWRGKGAELLGLSGQNVTRSQFKALLDGHVANPITGEIQRLDENSKQRRPGFDLQIAPPKSVSIVALVGKDERVVAAHKRAVETAMRGFETYGALARARNNGEPQVFRTGNLIWATILHESNRSNEPQLHSHNVVPAITYDSDSTTWRSLTNDEILRIRTEMDGRYKAALAKDLKELGYELRTDRKAGFEIVGISKEQITGFSTRSEQIEEMLAKWGIKRDEADYAQRQAAGLATRDDKNELTRPQLDEIWSVRATELGLNADALVKAALTKAMSHAQEVGQTNNERNSGRADGTIADRGQTPRLSERGSGQSPPNKPSTPSQQIGKSIEQILHANHSVAPTHELAKKDAIRSVQWATLHLSEREQVFERKDVIDAALRFGMGKHLGPEAAEWAMDELVRNEFALEFAQEGKLLVMLRSSMEMEVQMLKTAEALRKWHNPVVTDTNEFEAFREVYERRESASRGTPFKLSGEQAVAAKDLLMHPESIQGVQGGAGTGKTASIKFAAMVAQEKGMLVMGMATTSSAASKLQETSGILSNTVAAFNIERDELIASKKQELAALQKRINADTSLRGSGAAQIEVAKLDVNMPGKNFGRSRYVFDHEEGSVFRLEQGLRSSIGGWMLEKSLKAGRFGVGVDPTNRDWRHQAAIKVSVIGKTVSRSLSRYEIVDATENVEARNSLLLKRNQAVVAFGRVSAELDNLAKTGNVQGKQFMFVLDEASMTGTKDTQMILKTASELNARVVVQGDQTQHHSIAAGRAMKQLQDLGVNFNILNETYRFKNASNKTKAAMDLLAAGKYRDAFERLPFIEYGEKGVLSEVVADQYGRAMDSLREKGIDKPTVGVVTLTNADRKDASFAVHQMLSQRGDIDSKNFSFEHFDMSNLTTVQKRFVSEMIEWRKHTDKSFTGGQVELYAIFNKAYLKKSIVKHDIIKITGFDLNKNLLKGTSEVTGKEMTFNPSVEDFFSLAKKEFREYATGDKVVARHIINLNDGQFTRTEGTVLSKQAEKDLTRIKNGLSGKVTSLDSKSATIEWADGRTITLDTKQMRMVDWAYARTSLKEQGNDNHVELFALSSTGNFILKERAAYVAATRGKIDTVLITPARKQTLDAVAREDKKTIAMEVQKSQSIDESIGQVWKKIVAHRERNGQTTSITNIPATELTPKQQQNSPSLVRGR